MHPYTSDDEQLLVGREAQVRAAVDHCSAGRVVVVSAEPCHGVTSFLGAGLGPALRRDGCIVVEFRNWPGRYFAAALRSAVSDAVQAESGKAFATEGEELGEILRRGCKVTGRRIALILDQFEDYLRCHGTGDIAEAFDAELSRAAQLSGAAPIIFGLQDHALESFRRLQQVIPNLLGGHITLGPLSRGDASIVVKNEAERRRMTCENGLAELLTASPAVASGGGIHPYLLAAGVERLAEAEIRMRSGAMRVATVAEYGGPEKLVLESLDLSLGELSSTHGELFFRLCNILISPEGKRQAASEQALTDYSGKLSRFVLTLLPVLTGKNLLRPVEVRDGIRYEIARDAMVPIIRAWWEKREAVMVARSRAAFRIRSLSVAVGAMILAYVVWIFLTWKGRGAG